MGLSQSTPDPHHGYEYHQHHQQNRNRSYQPRSSRPRPQPRRTSFPSSAAAAIPTMPTFFSFQQGSERAQNTRYHFTEASPLLGRFRAVPRPADRIAANSGRRISSSVRGHGKGQGVGLGLGSGSGGQGLLSVHNGGGGGGGGGGSGIEDLGPGWRGSVHVGYGYGALAAAMESDGDGDDEEDDDDEEDEGGEERHAGCCCSGDGRFWRRLNRRVTRGWRRFGDTWVDPKASVVRKVVDVWWSRWTALVVFPALLAVAWCAVPFPQYPLPDDDDRAPRPGEPGSMPGRKVPGHGAAKVQVNFWFFLFVYYSFYNLTALIWITKVFNIYSLNWWPQSLGFPITVSAIAIISIAAPIPIYLVPEAKFLTVHNTAWISWTFVIMAMPVAIAFCILMTNERHLGLRHSLSETQRIFTSSWWAGEPDNTISRRDSRRIRAALDASAFDPSMDPSTVGFADSRHQRPAMPVRLRRRWLPASFVRFVWFCIALSIGLLAYVIGEAYAEIYLRTLPHNNWETIVYVYGWISTVHLLDGLTGWILGGNEGERVGSYPLSWIFKLYFMLTYQTYVRALYARLRSPTQFISLQILSSTGLIIVTPLLMSAPFHWFLAFIGVNSQSYGTYQKICIRNVFIRFLAENASMLAFLGSVVVLHFGANKDVYPYFAFDGTDETEDYDFNLTFYASSITWACELTTSFIVAGLIRWIYKVSVVTEGKLDFIVWPELLPTCVAVMLHVLQNMLFSIIRLQFH